MIGEDWREELVTGEPAFCQYHYWDRMGAMFIMGNFINALAIIIDYLLTAYTWIIIAQAILSWVRPDPYSPIVRFLYAVTEPVLRPIRRRMPAGLGGIDFSPMVVILAIIFLQHFVVDSLRQLARQM